jgi:hypothetical protein
MDQIDRAGGANRTLAAFCGAFGGMFGLVVLAIIALPIVVSAIYLAGWLITMLTR